MSQDRQDFAPVDEQLELLTRGAVDCVTAEELTLAAREKAATKKTKKKTKTPADAKKLDEAQVVAEAETASPSARWIDALLESAVYSSQCELVQKHAPKADQIRAVVATLTAEGGSMTPVGFANKVGVPLMRVDGLLARVRRILNFDGYEVLVHDRERNLVELDVELLVKQFELELA